MHITLLVLYGLTSWLAVMAYALIAGTVSLATVALAGPFIISGAVVFLVALDLALRSLTAAVLRQVRARRAVRHG